MPFFNHQAAAAYARRWAYSTNPQYPRFFDNQGHEDDCTNFVSQAMLAGGWTMADGTDFDRQSESVWWYGKALFARASYTWAGADNFARWILASQRGVRAKDPMELQPGDVLQIRFAGQRQIHHSTVVTGKTGTDLLLSYHTTDHLDESYHAIVGRSPAAEFIPWKISSYFFFTGPLITGPL